MTDKTPRSIQAPSARAGQALRKQAEQLAREKAALREENESLRKRLENLEEQVGRLLQP